MRLSTPGVLRTYSSSARVQMWLLWPTPSETFSPAQVSFLNYTSCSILPVFITGLLLLPQPRGELQTWRRQRLSSPLSVQTQSSWVQPGRQLHLISEPGLTRIFSSHRPFSSATVLKVKRNTLWQMPNWSTICILFLLDVT